MNGLNFAVRLVTPPPSDLESESKLNIRLLISHTCLQLIKHPHKLTQVFLFVLSKQRSAGDASQ